MRYTVIKTCDQLSVILFYSYSLTTMEYIVPLVIITFAYTRIAFRLWGNKTPGQAQDSRDQNLLMNKKKVRQKHKYID